MSQSAATAKASSAGHFQLQIDKHISTAYLKSVDGGHIRTQVAEGSIGPSGERIKHNTIADIDPLSFEVGFAESWDILKWVQSSWRNDHCRRDGIITHADFDYHPTDTHEFYDALITEVTFPELNGSSKDPAYLKVKAQPERIRNTKMKPSQDRIKPAAGEAFKDFSPSAFRLSLEGIDDLEWTNKIESFTIKQGVKKFYTGGDRFPAIEPTKVDFPNITGTLAAHYCNALWKWHEKVNVKGDSTRAAYKSGSLVLLGPDRKEILFRLNLYEVGLNALSIVQSTANQNELKRVKFELFVGRMDLDGPGKLALK